jgi:hypothetical protein
MKELRLLLIDCRIALRKSAKDFQKTELCEQLDAAIHNFDKLVASVAPAAAPAAAAPPPVVVEKTLTANQVGLAWQRAARDLKTSHPELYDKLSNDVVRMLDARSVVDPTVEIQQLEKTAGAARKKAEELEHKRANLELERDTLLAALAKAVPDLTEGPDRLAVALARIDQLVLKAAAPAPAPRTAAAAQQAAADSHVPSDETLKAVQAGAKQFTRDQRDWVLGEAMVLAGFRYTHGELLEQGEPWLAQLILDARKG